MPSSTLTALRALPLTLADFATGAFLYEFVSPLFGLVLGIVGVVLLGSVVYQLTRSMRAYQQQSV